MRPIDRGPLPKENNGIEKKFKNYQSIRADLILALGQYCCYCNLKLPSALAVEHIQPKSLNRDLELEWTNLLLSCPNCNSHKGSKAININNYLWPDEHNTHIAFKYLNDGRIVINDSLSEAIKIKAQNLLDLVGLQQYANIEGAASDRRWTNRKDAIQKSRQAHILYEECAKKGCAKQAAELISLWAQDSGFFFDLDAYF